MATIVHIVDDDPSFRTSTSRLLRGSGYEVAMYESAKQLLEHMPDDSRPGCILLDVQIPGLTGPELQRRLVTLGCALPVVFLTGHGDIPTTVQAMKAGADDFLTKPVAKDKLIEAVDRAVARSQALREKHVRLRAMQALIDTLTPREQQVFQAVIRGKMNKQIAGDLGTSERTIKAHRRKVMEKMRVQSLSDLVLIAERLGILTAPKGNP